MRSVLVILECGTELYGATAVVRAFQYTGLFAQHPQIRATFVSRRSPRYHRLCSRLKSRWWSRPLGSVLAKIENSVTQGRERAIVAQSRRHDCVYMLRIPSIRLHRALWREQRAKVVMDLNDGLWLPFSQRPGGGFENFHEMLQSSHAVACENEYLLAYARKYNTNAHLVPDAPQVEEFDKVRGQFMPSGDRVILGWIGSPSTADNLHVIFEPLEELFAQNPRLHLRILGATAANLPRFEKVRYSCKASYTNPEMIQEALQMHVGLFPLYRTEDAQVRGTLKARIYMSAAIAAACQNWGELPRLIQHGVNGVLAGSADDWLEKLRGLVENQAQRQELARQGLETIRSQFTRQMCFDRLLSVLMA
ncbi:glycosyltransferase [Prosthecobacter sp.]|uniref:glycosyltransferase family protein n=1 Tax=Prosthecobacter sp. TaxID=1965333 RepID=UPI003784DBB4